MNRSPEMPSTELNAEQRLASADCRPDDPELAADWILRRELRGLGVPPLPSELRLRVMKATRRPHRPAWWLGLAAAVVIGVAVVLMMEPIDQPGVPATVSETDLHDLQLALASLEIGTRRAGNAAGQQLAQGLSAARIDLDEVPYANELGHWIEPRTTNND